MVVRERSLLPKISSHGSSSPTGFKYNVLYDHANALSFYPIEMDFVPNSSLVIILLSLLQFLELCVAFGLALLIKGVFSIQDLILKSFITSLMIILMGLGFGYMFRRYLNKSSDSNYMSYVYACMLSTSYSPIAVFFAVIYSPIIFVSIMVLEVIMQYYISSCITKDYQFRDQREHFIYTLILLISTFSFAIILFIGVI